MKKILFAVCIVVIMLLTGCSEKYVASVGDKKISESEFSFYLNSIKSQMSGTELQSEEDWKRQEIEGMKAIDFAKERALEAAAVNVAYIEIAKALDIELTDEDEEYIKSTKKSIVSSRGGENGYKEYLKENAITDDFIEMLCESMIYSTKLAEKAITESPVTDEEKAEIFSELSVYGNYKAKHILFSVVDGETMQPLDDETVKNAKNKAEEVLGRVKKGEDFDALMHEYSEDPGLATSPDGYVFSSGEMVPEFESCVAGLEFNSVGFTESQFGYHIIKRLPLDITDLEKQIESKITEDRLLTALDKWRNEFSLSTVKNDVVFNEIS